MKLFLGYCPQFDALFDNLTARETLHIFGLLRGIPARIGAASARYLANSLGFIQHFDKKVTLTMSGCAFTFVRDQQHKTRPKQNDEDLGGGR